jgi:succinoglycan biosynthesis protein ExoA
MPSVSIIVPCYNEKARISTLLDAIYAQNFPREQLEVVIADGMSTDGTRDVITSWGTAHSDLKLRVVDNLRRVIPAGLNRAIEASTGEIIIRLDGHAAPYPDYVTRSVSVIEGNLAENAGGIWEIRPGAQTWVAESIAIAAAHPLGVGDALYRHATIAVYVETVPFGAFRRDLWERIGKFDENLLTNEDYEFNVRVQQSGGRIWLDPAIRSIYYARSTLGELTNQYWRYGFWKYRMLRRYPKTIRWRQGLPPLFVLSLLIGMVLSWIPLFGWLLLIEIVLYAIALFFAGARSALKFKKIHLLFGLPLAIASMHLSWGGGFLWSIIKSNQK